MEIIRSDDNADRMKQKIFILFSLFTLLCAGVEAKGTKAMSANDFLNSLGACSSVSRRGENLNETIENVKYTGLRWLRVGYEDDVPVEDFIRLHRQTNVLLSFGLLSGGNNIDRLITESRQLAEAGALLAIEGANEPNNWEITYQGEKGGGRNSWIPIANLHRDLYKAVKEDSILKDYPVWAISESGAQTDNTGLQFLIIPESANTLMPAGTQYADYANCHNYIMHPSWSGLHDNQTWLSASPTKDCPVDGLYANYGLTWAKKFPGYPEDKLKTLPRVTTETGYAMNEKEGVTEEIQARLYLNLYLSQYKRGWKHTAIYLLKGRANEPDHEAFAFYTLDNQPKQAAHYLHNFTTILADNKSVSKSGVLDYTIPDQPDTTHDLLLQKSDGHFYLVLWGERFAGGTDSVTVKFGKQQKTVKIYNPTVGILPIKILNKANSLPLLLTNHPLIIEIEK